MTHTKCESCGKTFRTFPSFVKKGGGRFCSNSCRGLWLSKSQIGKAHHNWRGGLIQRVCEECGNTFKAFPASVKKGLCRFCCRKCLSIWRSKNQTGEKSPSWKGGGTTLQLRIRGSRRYIIWRNDIFKRDNFTCRFCGSKCGNGKRIILHAHHLRGLSVIVDDFRVNYPLLPIEFTVVEFKDLWNIDNGITLCKKCHKDEHKRQNEIKRDIGDT